MYSLKFNEDLCATCFTTDCLVECQYMDIDRDTAHDEMMKIVNGEASSVLDNCVTCYSCEEYCPRGNHPFYLISERREETGRLVAPRPVTNIFAGRFAPRGVVNVGELGDTALSWCVFNFSGLAKTRLFEDIASSYIQGPDISCQVAFMHYAKPSFIKERLPNAINEIRKLGIKELICIHDECYGSFTSLAPAYGMEVPFKPVHYFEYLYDRLKGLKSEIKPLNVRAAYQRNCSSRLSPHIYPLVEAIFDLIGVDLVQRKYNGESGLCCGDPLRELDWFEVANDIQKRNVDDMAANGAEYCVFNCPACQMSLAEKVAREGMKPIHMIDLCGAAIGEKKVMEVVF